MTTIRRIRAGKYGRVNLERVLWGGRYIRVYFTWDNIEEPRNAYLTPAACRKLANALVDAADEMEQP